MCSTLSPARNWNLSVSLTRSQIRGFSICENISHSALSLPPYPSVGPVWLYQEESVHQSEQLLQDDLQGVHLEPVEEGHCHPNLSPLSIYPIVNIAASFLSESPLGWDSPGCSEG